MDGEVPTVASLSAQRVIPAELAMENAIPMIVSPTGYSTSREPEASHQMQSFSVDSPQPTASQLLAQTQADHMAIEQQHSARSTPQYPGLPSRYELVEKLGDGTFSIVYRARDHETNSMVAIKVVRKQDNKPNAALDPAIREINRATQRTTILQEVQVMRRLRHHSIVQLYDFIESEEYCFLVLEMLDGGELFDQIVNLTYMSENLARHVIVQVAEGIRYMHEECGIVHRDIKPENLLYEKIDMIPSDHVVKRPYDEDKMDEGKFIPGVGGGGIGRVKIADFGLSKIVWAESTKTPCGTVGYAAPEIVRDEHYTHSVDMWALGCVLYTLLCGFPPFYDESIKTLSEKVSRGQYSFLSPWWDDISDSAKDLVSKLLCVDVNRCLTISQFLQHPWVKEGAVPSKEPEKTVPAKNAPASAVSHIGVDPVASIADSPLLASLQAGEFVNEGRRSANRGHLREAFDISFAVHRLDEEMRTSMLRQDAKRHQGWQPRMNPVYDSAEYEESMARRRYGNSTAKVIAEKSSAANRARAAAGQPPTDYFNLSLDGASILERRMKGGDGRGARRPPQSSATNGPKVGA